MDGVRLAKLAVFLQLDPVRVIPLILLSAVIPLFTLSAFNGNSYSHPFTPPDTLLLKSSIRQGWCQCVSFPVFDTAYIIEGPNTHFM